MSALLERPGAETLPDTSGAAILLNGHYAPPPADADGKTWVRTTALVRADAASLYNLWRDVASAPLWHERIESVTVLNERTHRWVMRKDDETLEWDFEILADEPGRRIAWRSTKGEPVSAGEVIFEPAPGARGTFVILLECFQVGKIANAWESIAGRGPKQSAIENLRHFKALAETGEIPRNEPQPHGDRGFIAGAKQKLYGETVPTPPAINTTR